MDEERRDELLSDAAAAVRAALETVRSGRDHAVAACSDDIDVFDAEITELEQIAAGLDDLVVFRKMWEVVQRHGKGPYPPEDMAAFVGADPVAVRRVLTRLVEEGLATDDGTDPDTGLPL